VLETKPGTAVSVIECDLNVDFAPPVGYEEPTRGTGSAARRKESAAAGAAGRSGRDEVSERSGDVRK
jgi:hypothetical protein